MNLRLPLSVATLLLSVSAATASVETIYLGGRWLPRYGFTLGYIDAIDGRDTAGDYLNELVYFSHSAALPGPITISLDTPDFDLETFNFTTLATFTTNSAGTFFQLTDANHDAYAVNLPYFGIPSFGLYATFDYTAPSDPPPCLNCGPTAAPEPSTWLMLLLGFGTLAIATIRRGVRRDFSKEVSS